MKRVGRRLSRQCVWTHCLSRHTAAPCSYSYIHRRALMCAQACRLRSCGHKRMQLLQACRLRSCNSCKRAGFTHVGTSVQAHAALAYETLMCAQACTHVH